MYSVAVFVLCTYNYTVVTVFFVLYVLIMILG